MNWLARLLGYVPAEEREGIRLPPGPHWEVDEPAELAGFFRALPELIPPGSVLYLEGGDPSRELRSVFEKHVAKTATQVAVGTLWPRPQRIHLQITCELLDQLATLAETRGMWEFGWHVHVYHEQSVIVEWYDAMADPIWLSNDLPEETVARFSAGLGAQYRRVEDGGEQ
ncbi:MAG: hypothetical protein MUQ65_00125 [Armatimonadetes bacterium]|nr:hypothetical protein [Armatimonadota bacterium]